MIRTCCRARLNLSPHFSGERSDHAAIQVRGKAQNRPEQESIRLLSIETSTKKARLRRAFRRLVAKCSAQVAAEALDALAGVFEVRGLGRVGNAERRAEAEGRA